MNNNKQTLLTEEQLSVVEVYLQQRNPDNNIKQKKSAILDVGNMTVQKYEFKDFSIKE